MYEKSGAKILWTPQELDGYNGMTGVYNGRSAKIPGKPQELQGWWIVIRNDAEIYNDQEYWSQLEEFIDRLWKISAIDQ